MKNVYILWHTHVFDDGSEDDKQCGVYSSREAAEAAKTRLLLQPGFKDHPDGFMIDTPEIDKDQWTEGFITVLHGDE